MAVPVNNAVRGKIQYYVEQARDTAAGLGALLLISAGLEGETTFSDRATVADILAATNDEATFTNYARKALPNPTVTIDNPNDRVLMGLTGAAPVTIRWDNAGGPIGGGGIVNNLVGRMVIYYDPTPGTSTDAQLIPLFSPDVAAQTDGTHLVVTIDAEGIARARRP